MHASHTPACDIMRECCGRIRVRDRIFLAPAVELRHPVALVGEGDGGHVGRCGLVLGKGDVLGGLVEG